METLTKNTSGPIAHAASLKENFPDISLYEIREIKETVCSKEIPLFSPLLTRSNFILKRSLDITLSLFLIIFVLSWLTPLLAILIKLDSQGPVFFRQRRNKNRGRVFTCIKFRTMIVNSDADVLSACENDKRITMLGGFLRKHHIDELPQLFNVIAGDMSIIGPRPHMVSENSTFENIIDEYARRHTILPGITGLAQSYGNFGATNDIEKVKQRVKLDLYYIRKWSLIMDLKILVRTGRLMLGL